MPLHLVKLCVGCDSIADLEGWIAQKRQAAAGRRRAGSSGGGGAAEHVHVTRMFPKRADELLDGGSLYWVIRGMIACRQQLLAVRPVTDASGGRRCGLVLDPAVVAVHPAPMRAFQGWRYFPHADAPRDLSAENGKAGGVAELPEELRRELYALGLL